MQYKVRSNIAWQIYDDVVYIFDDVNRQTYILEEISVLIWKLINKGYNYNCIIDYIANTYIVDEATVTSDVNDFIETLIDNNILEVAK